MHLNQEFMVPHYDYIVVGGGIAGLYFAYRMSSTNKTILVLEKSNRYGGRLGTSKFRGVNVVCGAGIGRKDKDKLLMSLLTELKVDTREFEVDKAYARTLTKVVDYNSVWKTLVERHKTATATEKHTPFRTFAKMVLGPAMYREFVETTGYTDFENEDTTDVLYNYGMDDNFPGWVGVSIPWSILVSKLVAFLKSKPNVTLKKSHEVDCVARNDLGAFTVKSKTARYQCNAVTLATTITSIRNLLPKHAALYKAIEGQPFVRIYAQFSKASRRAISKLITTPLVVPAPLQKIIPINPEKGIYMIAYADNKSATYFSHPHHLTTEHLEYLVAKSISTDVVEINYIQVHYWSIGTHYYKPLPKEFTSRQNFVDRVQNPEDDIYVVGEVVAMDQGWTEGALKSVENALKTMHPNAFKGKGGAGVQNKHGSLQ